MNSNNAIRSSLEERERQLETLRQSLEQNERVLTALRQSIEAQKTQLRAERDSLSHHENQVTSLQQQLTDTASATNYKIALALTLANAAYDALLVLDEDFNVIAINDSAGTWFEHKRPIGETLGNVTKSPELMSLVEDSLVNAEESLEEQLVVGKRTCRVKVQVVRRDEHVFIGVALQDISELVRLARARRDMVANISHELRTPIANIKLIIEGLFHEQEKPKRKQSASALKAIARDVDSMLWLVQGMHDLSMIESGEAMLRMFEFPVSELVGEAIDRMSDQGEEKSLKIVADDIPQELQVLADQGLALRVLVNLIHNGIKWSPPNQSITVSAFETADEDDYVTICVSDRGPGVPEEHRERIFERFYQIDTARSRGDGGSGLGLAICKHIVEAHEGRIWVEEAPGGGARFCFTLPKAFAS
jgi:two-component system phosphate regulon sensor histidine kinase PhoR